MESLQQKRYTKTMRILFVEGYPLHHDNWFSQPLRTMLEAVSPDDVCAVYGSENRRYKVKLYNAVQQNGFFYREGKPGRSYEEDLFSSGYSRRSFLQKDIGVLNNVIETFAPDLIIDFGRISTSVCACKQGVPYRTFVCGAMYRKHSSRPEYLKELNRILSDNGLEQILRLSDLNAAADTLYAFGTLNTDPLPEELNVTRVGGSLMRDTTEDTANGISIILPSASMRTSKLNRIIRDTFLGAPYTVTVHLSQKYPESGNLAYTGTLKMELLKDRKVIIHDGNLLAYHECIARGIPQIVIHDGSWKRSWIAACCVRNCSGLSIDEEELSVASLYEAYRRLVSDDYYQRRADWLKKETASLSRLSDLLK